MARRHPRVSCMTASLMLLVGTAGAQSQTDPSPEHAHKLLVAFNEGVLAYYEQPLDVITPTEFEAAKEAIERAIGHFDRVLEIDPRHTVGRLMRALCRGRLGLAAGRVEHKLPDANEKSKFRATGREHYLAMQADLKVLSEQLDAQAIFKLIRVVGMSKLAEIDKNQALQTADEDERSELAGASAQMLDDALQLLGDLLDPRPGEELDPPDRVRAMFFDAVLTFRRALPPLELKGSVSQEESVDLLYRAKKVLEKLYGEIPELLKTDPDDARRWQSYCALYLGLILPGIAQQHPDIAEATRLLDEALEHLDDALRLDEGADGSSVSGDVIPKNVEKQKERIEEIREELSRRGRRSIDDIRFTLQWGVHRDTNVPLLGERTDLPSGISDERDFGFQLGAFLDYTGSFDRVFGGSEDLDRWTLGLQARTTQLWHADIDEFDEQDYGGSVAVQYELDPEGRGFPLDGPTFVSLQYDYDYLLVGKDKFLDAHRLLTMIRRYSPDENRTHRTDLSYAHSFRDYNEANFDRRLNRDGTYARFSLIHSVKLKDLEPYYKSRGLEPWGDSQDDSLLVDHPDYPKRFIEVYGGLRYGWDSTSGDEFDLKSYSLLLGGVMPLPHGWSLTGDCEFEWQNYSHGSIIDFRRRPRRDFIQRYGVAASRTFILRGGNVEDWYARGFSRLSMDVRVGAFWTLDDSNVEDRLGEVVFEYDRVVYGLSVRLSFN